MKNYLFEGMDKFISRYREEDNLKKKLKESFDEEEFEIKDYLPDTKDIIKFFVAGTTREKVEGAKKVLDAMKDEIMETGTNDLEFYKDDQNIKEFIYDMQDNTGEFGHLLGDDEDLDESYLEEETNMDKINKYLKSIGESPITEDMTNWDKIERIIDDKSPVKKASNFDRVSTVLDRKSLPTSKRIEKTERKFSGNSNWDKIEKTLDERSNWGRIKELNKNNTVESLIEELIEAISPEDQKDSDILRDIITKSHNRINAKLTPEEKKIMNKYGLRRNSSGDIYVGDSIYRDSKLDRGFSRSELKKVNLADRARKALPRIEKNIYRDEEGKDISYAAVERHRRGAEEEVMSSKVDRMKNVLRDRSYHSKKLAGIDKEYDKKIADLEKQIAKAEEDREWHRKHHAENQSNAQEKIDKLLKKQAKPVTESVKKGFKPMNLFESMNRGFEKLYGKIDDIELEDKYAPARKSLNESCKKEKKPLKEATDETVTVKDIDKFLKDKDKEIKKLVKYIVKHDLQDDATLYDSIGDMAYDYFDSFNTPEADKYLTSKIDEMVAKEEKLQESINKKPLKEYKDMGQDLGEYQKWVDYDMKKDGKISHKTMSEIKKAGLSVVKDQYGQYEVIADKTDTNSKKNKLKENYEEVPKIINDFLSNPGKDNLLLIGDEEEYGKPHLSTILLNTARKKGYETFDLNLMDFVEGKFKSETQERLFSSPKVVGFINGYLQKRNVSYIFDLLENPEFKGKIIVIEYPDHPLDISLKTRLRKAK